MQPTETDWTAVFQSDDYLYFYEQALSEDITNQQVGFVIDTLRLAPGARVLDIACGHGRHANALARAGYQVTGLDISRDFLRLARQRAQALGVEVDYVEQDMRSMSFASQFDAALLLFTSFGYFCPEENAGVLAQAKNALKPGGGLVLDVLNRDALLASFRPFLVVERGDDVMAEQVRFEPVDGTLHNHRIMVRDGQVRKVDFTLYVYNASQIKGMLTNAGFSHMDFYGSWEGGSLQPTSRRLLVVAHA